MDILQQLFVCVCSYMYLVFSDSATPRDYSPPGSSIQGIVQARMLEWVTISFFRESSHPRDQTHVSWTGRRVFTLRHWGTLVNANQSRCVLNQKNIPVIICYTFYMYFL